MCPVNTKVPVAGTGVEVGFAFIYFAGYAEGLETLGY